MKYLGIDYGQKRIGLSISDGMGCMAFPLQTLLKSTRDMMFMQLLQIIKQHEITHIVLGLPKNNGEDSLTTRQVYNFAASLQRRCTLPLCLVDESYSSQEATQDLQSLGLSAVKRKLILDQQAAVRILQSYLDKQAQESFDEPII